MLKDQEFFMRFRLILRNFEAILTKRKLLIQLPTELEHSGMGSNKEHSSRLLGKLVSSAPRLIKPYMEPILKSKRRSISARQISTRFCLFFM